MKRFLNRLAEIMEISFAIRHVRLDQPGRDEDLYAMREMFEEKSK